MNNYVKLAEPPVLVINYPDCGTCQVSVEVDADGMICPSCGTSWDHGDGDGDEGELYESWSGEGAGPEVTAEEAEQIADYRKRLDSHERWSGEYPALFPKPRRPLCMDRLELDR